MLDNIRVLVVLNLVKDDVDKFRLCKYQVVTFDFNKIIEKTPYVLY